MKDNWLIPAIITGERSPFKLILLIWEWSEWAPSSWTKQNKLSNSTINSISLNDFWMLGVCFVVAAAPPALQSSIIDDWLERLVLHAINGREIWRILMRLMKWMNAAAGAGPTPTLLSLSSMKSKKFDLLKRERELSWLIEKIGYFNSTW